MTIFHSFKRMRRCYRYLCEETLVIYSRTQTCSKKRTIQVSRYIKQEIRIVSNIRRSLLEKVCRKFFLQWNFDVKANQVANYINEFIIKQCSINQAYLKASKISKYVSFLWINCVGKNADKNFYSNHKN